MSKVYSIRRRSCWICSRRKEILVLLIGALQLNAPAVHGQTTIPYYDPAEVCPAEATAKTTDRSSREETFKDCVDHIPLIFDLIKSKWENMDEERRQHCLKSARSIASYSSNFILGISIRPCGIVQR